MFREEAGAELRVEKVGRMRVRTVWVSTVVLIAVLVLVRLPFLSNTLIGEEGLFAYITTGPTPIVTMKNPSALIMGRVSGQDFIGMPQHPLIPYFIIGRILHNRISHDDFQAMSFSQKSRAARLPFFLMFCFGFGCVAFCARRVLRLRQTQAVVLFLFAFLFVGTTPLMVGGSIQPQVDGSVGVALIGVSVLLISIASSGSGTCFVFAWVLGGFFASLGKNEWTLALMASAAFVSFSWNVLARFFKVRAEMGEAPWVPLIHLSAGCLLGTMISYIASPENFVAGFHVMRRFSNVDIYTWFNVTMHNASWIWPLALLAGILASACVIQWKICLKDIEIVILCTWGILMTAGFLYPGWPGDGFPRHFIPAMLVLLSAVAAVLKKIELPRPAFKKALAVCCLGLCINFGLLGFYGSRGVSISSEPGTSLVARKNEYLKRYADFEGGGEPSAIDAAYGYYFRDADFINESMGEFWVKRFLTDHPWRPKDR